MSPPHEVARGITGDPDDFPQFDVDAGQEVGSELEDLKSTSYTGRDRDHLVSVVLDGEGMVQHIRIAGTAVTRTPQAVERAIAAAVADAQRRMDLAWRRVAGRVYPDLAAPEAKTADAPRGGIEVAYDATTDDWDADHG